MPDLPVDVGATRSALEQAILSAERFNKAYAVPDFPHHAWEIINELIRTGRELLEATP